MPFGGSIVYPGAALVPTEGWRRPPTAMLPDAVRVVAGEPLDAAAPFGLERPDQRRTAWCGPIRPALHRRRFLGNLPGSPLVGDPLLRALVAVDLTAVLYALQPDDPISWHCPGPSPG